MLSAESSDEELLDSVTLLHGPVTRAAEQIAALREALGITYFNLQPVPGHQLAHPRKVHRHSPIAQTSRCTAPGCCLHPSTLSPTRKGLNPNVIEQQC
jgi:hypothetical protein